MRYGVQRGPTRRLLVSAATLLMMLAASLLLIDRAAAADVGGSVTRSVTVNHESHTGTPPVYGTGERIRMDIDWGPVPASANAGDHFDVPLDPNLNPGSFIPFQLRDGNGQLVANATIVTNEGPPVVRFTFTSYVDTHNNVSGNAYFRMGFASRNDWNEGQTDMPLEVYGSDIILRRTIGPPPCTENCPPTGPNGGSDSKSGSFIGGEATLLLDENDAFPNTNAGGIRWTVQLKSEAGGANGEAWTTLTVVDTPTPGHSFRCDPAALDQNPRLRVWRRSAQGQPNAAYTSFTANCTPTSLTLTVTKQADDAGVFSFDVDTYINRDDQNRPTYTDANQNPRIGINPDGFGNSVSISYDGREPVMRQRTVRQSDQGGGGQGENLNPRIDIEKYNGTWDGVLYGDGLPALDENGQPVPQPESDHDTGPGLAVAPGASTQVTFRITNTGNETLDNVVVTDETLAGTALTDVVCTFEGSTQMPFMGLAPMGSFTCTATLPAITAPHADRAAVTAIGRRTGQNVGDQDNWHAHPAEVPPTPPAPPTDEQPTRTTLSIRKVALTRNPRAGTVMQWRVEVRNRGRIAAQNVRVCDPLPRALSLARQSVRIELTGTGRRTYQTGRLVMTQGQACVTIRSLAVGQMARFTVHTRITRTVSGALRNPVNAVAANAPRVSAAARVTVRRAQVAAVNIAVTG